MPFAPILPTGIQARRFVVQFNASSVPVMQISLSSRPRSTSSSLRLRDRSHTPQLAPIQGLQCRPLPAANLARAWSISNPSKCSRRAADPARRRDAVNTQNLTLPSATAKIDGQAICIAQMRRLRPSTTQQYPINVVNGRHRVSEGRGQVHDGWLRPSRISCQ